MNDGRLVQIDWEGQRRPRRDVILELHAAGMPVADIARRLGVIYQTVYITVQNAGRQPVTRARGEQPGPIDVGPVDAVLLGCVKTKDVQPRPAKDLYKSELFGRRRAYAEASGRPWWIVSAEYGLVAPDEVIAPYDTLIGSRPLHERKLIATQVADLLELELGHLDGLRLELHAGDEYFQAIGPTLRSRGAAIVRPLEGLSFGRQLAWYGDRLGLTATLRNVRSDPRPSYSRAANHYLPLQQLGDGRGLAKRITDLFESGALDLSLRAGAPAAGWEGMPEIVAVRRIRAMGADDVAVRRFLTFVAAMDRARDADRLASAAAGLYQASRWVFDPPEVVRRPLRELSDELRTSRVSQRHGDDSYAWRVLAETLNDPALAPEARAGIYDGVAEARRLLGELQGTTRSGTRLFPLLGGPKIGPLWVRLLAYPGGAEISSLEAVPVAVDVQVRKVTEYLGVTDTAGRDLEEVRELIQRTWAADVAKHGASGPDVLRNTPGAVDPALWFYAKWGCTFCERAGRQLPISTICGECRLGIR